MRSLSPQGWGSGKPPGWGSGNRQPKTSSIRCFAREDSRPLKERTAARGTHAAQGTLCLGVGGYILSLLLLLGQSATVPASNMC